MNSKLTAVFSPDLLTDFTKVKLSDEEQLDGFRLGTLSLSVLQNLRADVAAEKLRLEFNPLNPNDFIQQEAYKRGQLDIITYIINEALDANRVIKIPADDSTE